MELAELQAKLLIADSKAAGRRATGPLIALIVGFCFALSAAPVLLIATAELLIEYAALTRVTAYLASSAVGMLVGMSLLLVGYGGLRSSVGELKKSVEELAENISCIKRTLRPRDPSQ